MSVPNGPINLRGGQQQGGIPTARASAVDAFGNRNQGGRISIGMSEVTFGGFHFSYRQDSHSIVASDTAKRVDVKAVQLAPVEEAFAGFMRERHAILAITKFGAPEGGTEMWAMRALVVENGKVNVQAGIERHAGAFPINWIPLY